MATTATKTWRATIDRWTDEARRNRSVETLRGRIAWFERNRPLLTAVPEADSAAMAADLRAALTDLGA